MWAGALSSLYFKLRIDQIVQDPLRRRFANCLHWYNRLQQSTNTFVDAILKRSRRDIQVDAENSDLSHETVSIGNDTQLEALFTPESSPNPTIDQEDQQHAKRMRRDSVGSVRARPSAYLRARCPICFGGSSSFSEGYVFHCVYFAN